ncbi:MAG TPA: hypothetical protein PLG88_07835 [Chitinophagaceae bacterium]|nr:hypothetical protein [Chitinophagaceae bacterium]
MACFVSSVPATPTKALIYKKDFLQQLMEVEIKNKPGGAKKSFYPLHRFMAEKVKAL